MKDAAFGIHPGRLAVIVGHECAWLAEEGKGSGKSGRIKYGRGYGRPNSNAIHSLFYAMRGHASAPSTLEEEVLFNIGFGN
jgi:hypothetical protein